MLVSVVVVEMTLPLMFTSSTCNSLAVILPAAKSPLASRATSVLAVFASVAFVETVMSPVDSSTDRYVPAARAVTPVFVKRTASDAESTSTLTP